LRLKNDVKKKENNDSKCRNNKFDKYEDADKKGKY